MTAEAMRQLEIQIRRHIDIELDPVARSIAILHHNPDVTSLPHDIKEITREHIKKVFRLHGGIDVVTISTPCQDLSPANTRGEGLKGKESRLMYTALDILDMVKELNPSVKYLIENVQFEKKFPEQFAELNARIGHKPIESDAQHMSAANRKRYFWTNIPQPEHQPPQHPVAANKFLRKGCSLAGGRETGQCIMASWRCEACKHRREPPWCSNEQGHESHQYMHTGNPVRVQTPGATTPGKPTRRQLKPSGLKLINQRHLHPEEAEQMMGLAAGYTAEGIIAGKRVKTPNIERMKCIGGGIDVRQVSPILAGLRNNKKQVHPHVKPHTGWRPERMAKWLTKGPLPVAPESPQDTHSWEEGWNMNGVTDLIRCAIQGFPLRFQGDRTEDVEAPNGVSAERNPESTERELDKEIANGNILGPWDSPPLEGFRVTPRGLKAEATKDRPITQGNMPLGNAVNDGIPKASHLEMARIRDIDDRIRECIERTGQAWMAKADVKAAYRTQPVRPEDWQLQGIKWKGKYYIDTRMSFGCRSSVDQWLRISKALSYALTRWGVHNLTYIDDFIFIAASKEECDEAVRKFKIICADWGVVLKDEKDAGPAQKMTALGIEYDLIKLTRRITEKRRLEIQANLKLATKSRDRRLWENIVGVLWFVSPCIPIAQPYIYTLNKAVNRARHAKRGIELTSSTQSALDWMLHFTTDLNTKNKSWHGEHIIPTKERDVKFAMGDAGSEWGLGGFDGQHYFYTKWPDHMWDAVQRKKSSSSLHMEALQVLVAARALAHTWSGSAIVMRLDCLALVAALNKGRHQHEPINDIMSELNNLQMKHNFVLRPTWIRRFKNEAADALSKDDMPRFWHNIQGDRTLIKLTEEHLKLPSSANRPRAVELRASSKNAKRAGMRRTAEQTHDRRPVKTVFPMPPNASTKALSTALEGAIIACKTTAQTKVQVSGKNHYIAFCGRLHLDDLAPDLSIMRKRICKWIADAPHNYMLPNGKRKKALATGSIKTYLSHIDRWYVTTTNHSRGSLSRHPMVSEMMNFITANFKSGDRQVHGITYDILKEIMAHANAHDDDVACLLRASYSLAYYAMLRPTEYMLTPMHNTFDRTRHARASDIIFYKADKILHKASTETPDSFEFNIKMSKNDQQRLGASCIIGATGKDTCPVAAMWKYFKHNKPTEEGPLFTTPGGGALQYNSALRVLRMHIGPTGDLYGLHSFRVGGAQALALAGRSVLYIMSRGRWKSSESVSRYVAAPAYVQCADARDMSLTEEQRKTRQLPQQLGAWHTNLENGEVLPQY